MTVLSSHANAILDALQWQGRRNDCGPYATATVVNALCKTDLDGSRLAIEMNHPAWHGILPVIRRVPNWATFPWGMVDIMKRHGLNASWRILGNAEGLIQGLRQGDVLMPITGEWWPLWAHVMTLLAWDEHQGWGFANTQSPDRRLFWLDDATFQKRWNALGRLVVEIRG